MKESEDRQECMDLLSKISMVIDGHHKLPTVVALIGTLCYCGRGLDLSEDDLVDMVKTYVSDFYNVSKRGERLQ